MITSFIKNATFNIIADFSNRISNAIILILISRFLSVGQFGAFNIATTYLTFGMLLSFWGYGNLLTREVAKSPNSFGKYFFNFGIMRLIFSFISILIIFFIVLQFNYSEETFRVILIISLGIFAEAFKNLSFSAFNAFEKTYYASIVFFVSSLTKLILSYLLLHNHFGILYLAWLNTIINFIGAISLVFFIAKYLPPIEIKVNWKFNFDQTRIAIPLFLIAFFSIAENRLDVIILSGYFSETIVGFYSAAVVLQSALLIIPDGIRNAIYPVLSKISIEEPVKIERIYRVLFKFVTLITLAISVGGFILASKIILIVYKVNFLDSVNIFRLLMLSYPIYSIVIMNVRFLNAYNKDKEIAKIYALDMFIIIILNLFLTPHFGGEGAAFIKLIATLLLYILSFRQVKFLLPNFNVFPYLLRGIIATIIMGSILLLLINKLHLIPLVFIGFIIYIAALILMRTFGQEEIDLLKKLDLRKKLI